MRLRGLLIAVAVLAALGGGVYWSNKAEKAREGRPDPDAPPKVLSIPEEEFQKVEILKPGEKPLVLQQTDEGRWEMTSPVDWRVDQDSAGSLISSLSSLGSSRVVDESVQNLAPYGLEQPALEVRVTKKDGEVKTLYIGDESPAGGGHFVKLDGDGRLFTMATWNKSSIDKSPSDLRDKRLLTFDSDRLTRVELVSSGQQIEFGKNALNEWQIIRPQPLRADGGRVEDLVRKLSDARMDTFAMEQEKANPAAAFAAGRRVATARLTDASGTQELELRRGREDKYYARSSVVEGIFPVGGDLGDALDKSLADFRNKKLFDFGWTDPGRVEIREGDTSVAYEKSDGTWLSGSKQMDWSSVQSLTDKLRDLTATEFVDRGFTSPFFEVTVTSNDGKRVETVLISKQGDEYFAMRKDEPSIYKLDAAAVEELQKAAAEVKEHQAGEEKKD